MAVEEERVVVGAALFPSLKKRRITFTSELKLKNTVEGMQMHGVRMEELWSWHPTRLIVVSDRERGRFLRILQSVSHGGGSSRSCYGRWVPQFHCS